MVVSLIVSMREDALQMHTRVAAIEPQFAVHAKCRHEARPFITKI